MQTNQDSEVRNIAPAFSMILGAGAIEFGLFRQAVRSIYWRITLAMAVLVMLPLHPVDALADVRTAVSYGHKTDHYLIDPLQKYLVTVSHAKSEVKIWEISTGRLLSTQFVEGGIGDPTFTRDGRLMSTHRYECGLTCTAMNDNYVTVGPLLGGEESFSFDVSQMQYDAQEEAIVTMATDDDDNVYYEEILRFNLSTNQEVWKFKNCDGTIGDGIADEPYWAYSLLLPTEHIEDADATEEDMEGDSEETLYLCVIGLRSGHRAALLNHKTGDWYLIEKEYLIRGIDENRVEVINLASGDEIIKFNIDRPLWDASYKWTDGNQLVFYDRDMGIAVIDLMSGDVKFRVGNVKWSQLWVDRNVLVYAPESLNASSVPVSLDLGTLKSIATTAEDRSLYEQASEHYFSSNWIMDESEVLSELGLQKGPGLRVEYNVLIRGEPGQRLFAMPEHININHILYIPATKRLLVASNHTYLIELANGASARLAIDSLSYPHLIAGTGEVVAFQNGDVIVFDPSSADVTSRFRPRGRDGDILKINVDASGRRLFAETPKGIDVYDLRTGRYEKTIGQISLGGLVTVPWEGEGGGIPYKNDQRMEIKAWDSDPTGEFLAINGECEVGLVEVLSGKLRWIQNIGMPELCSYSMVDFYCGTSEDCRNIRFSESGSRIVTDKMKDRYLSGNIVYDLDSGSVVDKPDTDYLPDLGVFSLKSEGREISSGADMIAEVNEDGSIVLRDVKNDNPTITLYLFPDASVALTPEGYFSGSGDYEKYVFFIDDQYRTYGLDQFARKFMRPEIVEQALSGKGTPNSSSGIDDILAAKPAPVVEILNPKSNESTSAETAEVRVRVTEQGGGIGDVRVMVNGAIAGTDGRALELEGDSEVKEMVFEIALIEGANEIKVLAFNGDNSMSSRPALVTVTSDYRLDAPVLHVLAIGIDRYENEDFNLRFAGADARLIADTLSSSAAPLFSGVRVTTLTSAEKTSRGAIEAKIEALAGQVKANDYFILFVASHGFVSMLDNGDSLYYLITGNVAFLDPSNLAVDAISQDRLVELMGMIGAQNKIIILDTCHAGDAGKALQVASLSKGHTYTRALSMGTAMQLIKMASGSSVFTASQGTEQAIEGYDGHGLFTYTLSEGLEGAADSNLDGFVSVSELKGYAERTVMVRSRERFKRSQVPYINIGTIDFSLAASPKR